MLVSIALASLVFLRTAARTVKDYQYWANLTDSFEKTLKERQAEVVSLRTADHEHPREDKTIGVQQLRSDLERVLANRGRVWTKCDKQKAGLDPNPKNPGIMSVTLSPEEPGAFAKNMLLYAFEEGDDQSPGKYLGEYRVDAVSEKQVVLASTTQMAASLAENVTKSKAPWVLYEMMPTDEHEAYANLPEEQRKSVPEEFIKDGQQDASGKKFERPLRDYLAIFRACEVHRALFADRDVSTTRDLGYLKTADEDAKNQEALAEKEKTQVEKEREWATAEREAVRQLLADRQNMLGIFQRLVQEAIADNLKQAQKIAKLQKEAADLIDRRTGSMAQFGPRTD